MIEGTRRRVRERQEGKAGRKCLRMHAAATAGAAAVVAVAGA